jgi:hypothetical protein
MKKILWLLALMLLLINGIGAIFGGISLMRDPTGGFMQMPVEWLQNSPFNDFLIPGIILFVFNGLFSLAVFVLTLIKYRHYPVLVVFQGCILTVWIIVQVLMLQTFHYLHAIFGGIGIVLIILGSLLWHKKDNL